MEECEVIIKLRYMGRLLSKNVLAFLLHLALYLVDFVDREVKYRKSTTLVYTSIGYEILLLMPCRLMNIFVSNFGFRVILDCVLPNLTYWYLQGKKRQNFGCWWIIKFIIGNVVWRSYVILTFCLSL